MKNTMEIAGALVRRRRGVLLSSARAVANPRRGHAVGSPRIDERHPPQGRGTPGIGPPKPDRAALSGDWPATRGRPPGKPKPANWPG